MTVEAEIGVGAETGVGLGNIKGIRGGLFVGAMLSVEAGVWIGVMLGAVAGLGLPELEPLRQLRFISDSET